MFLLIPASFSLCASRLSLTNLSFPCILASLHIFLFLITSFTNGATRPIRAIAFSNIIRERRGTRELKRTEKKNYCVPKF